MTNHNLSFYDHVRVSDSMSTTVESGYLVSSNRQKCRQLLRINNWSDENLIDFFISLHLVLEVGLNSFLRHISLQEMQKRIERLKLIKNLDNINFIEKTILFIYNSKFDFGPNLNDADKYHSIIDTIRDFSAPRNQLLHGHSLSTVYENGNTKQSGLRSQIQPKNVQLQINKFIFIMEGMRFYFDCLQSTFTPFGKESLKNEYLDCNFLLEVDR